MQNRDLWVYLHIWRSVSYRDVGNVTEYVVIKLNAA